MPTRSGWVRESTAEEPRRDIAFLEGGCRDRLRGGGVYARDGNEKVRICDDLGQAQLRSSSLGTGTSKVKYIRGDNNKKKHGA